MAIVARNTYTKIIWAVMLQMIFSYFSYSQSKHTMLWNIGGHCYDFNNKELNITEHNYGYNTRWYVDEIGKIRLFCKEGKVYNEHLELLKNSTNYFIESNNCFFIPNPCDENFVYCIYGKNYLLINLERSEIIENITYTDISYNYNAAVYSENNNIWFLCFDKNKIIKYLINNHNIEYRGSDIYKCNYDTCVVKINISINCKYYSAGFLRHIGLSDETKLNEVHFGSFDNINGSFSTISRHIFPEYDWCENTIISPDNSKVYYIMMRKMSYQLDLLEVNIINNEPDFDNYKVTTICEDFKGLLTEVVMSYAYDGNIYILLTSKKRVDRIFFYEGGNNKYERFYFVNKIFQNTLNFIPSWFSSDYQILNCTPKISVKTSCSGYETSFSITNMSEAKTVIWNFGDGNISAEFSPTHIYTKSGKYIVTLIVTFSNGENKTFTQEVIISPLQQKPKIICE